MSNQHTGFDWTEERVELLTKLWGEGKLSAKAIAAQLGDISRNAVISKVHRMGLPGREPRKAPSKPKSERHYTLSPARIKALRVEAVPDPAPPIVPQEQHTPGIGMSLLDFEDHPANPRYCRWPVNSPPRGGEYLFCGEKTKAECSYCAYHEDMAHVPAGKVNMWKVA